MFNIIILEKSLNKKFYSMGRTDIFGTILSLEDSKKVVEMYKDKAIMSFMLVWKKFKDLEMENNRWGDECEYHVLNVDSDDQLARYRLFADKYISDKIRSIIKDEKLPCLITAEVGNWELEFVPRSPYTTLFDPTPLFEQMKLRRDLFSKVLAKQDHINTNGMPLVHRAPYKYYADEADALKHYDKNENYKVYLDEETKSKIANNEWIGSKQAPDVLFTQKAVYLSQALKTNLRKGETVIFDIPIWKDKNTPSIKTDESSKPGYISLDNVSIDSTAIANLQGTFGTKNLSAARYLHDQMHVLTPITYALSAASPIMSGKLLDSDCHYLLWKWFMDGRTKEELDPKNPLYLPKPRNWTAGYYISDRDVCKQEYNDVDIRVDEEIIEKAQKIAKELGVDIDDRMLKHLGYMFVWYLYVVYPEFAQGCDPTKNIGCYEVIEADHLVDIRFRAPKSFDSDAGWLVEFRSLEMQPTDEENISFLMFLRLMSEMIQDDGINMYIPISKVDENMERAMRIDAAIKEKFWFRKDLSMNSKDDYGEYTIEEILVGKKDELQGIIPRLEKYVLEKHSQQSDKYYKDIVPLLDIIVGKATGKVPTVAAWMRQYVLKHPNYKQDSNVPNEAISELVLKLSDLFFKRQGFDTF